MTRHLAAGVYGAVGPNPKNTLITNNVAVTIGHRFTYQVPAARGPDLDNVRAVGDEQRLER
jgi:hypothetical protein